ncbi:MAG TPA: cupin domain-containing protein [Chloroflexota bacterium]|jgi:gentisate 1,2-dioxygenase|nr:cupin domain-containing protein [Chloroflexota bacterium]
MAQVWTDPTRLAELNAALARLHLRVHQPGDPPLMTREPESTVQAHRWRWREVRPLFDRLGELVPLERGGERRTLRLTNPGLPYGTTHTLWASLQLIYPGEVASAHRHAATALRFILEGEGAYTVVDGAPYPMRPGDLVLTPAWSWHDHAHQGSAPMLWLDVLDIPLVRALHTTFFEPYPAPQQPLSRPVNESVRRYGDGTLRPAGDRPSGPASARLAYPWARTAAVLHDLAELGADPHEGVAVEYRDPATGRGVLPTMACWAQLLPPGFVGRPLRRTSSALYHVVQGAGATTVGGERLEWEPGDFLVVPPWTWHAHETLGASEALLFSVHDRPVYEALGLYREERA